MVDTTLSLLPYLGITVSINIILGLFHSTRTLHERFSIKKFLISLLKSIIIGTSFISLAFVFDKMDLAVALRDYLIEPDLLLYSAIIVYLSKALVNLQNILGVNKLTEKQTKIFTIMNHIHKKKARKFNHGCNGFKSTAMDELHLWK